MICSADAPEGKRTACYDIEVEIVSTAKTSQALVSNKHVSMSMLVRYYVGYTEAFNIRHYHFETCPISSTIEYSV